MALKDDLKRFRGGGLDTDSSPEDVAPNDYQGAVNWRNTGTSIGEEGYSTNIESNTLLAGMLLAGINDCVGGGAFEDIRQAAIFRTNSAGNNQILLYDFDSNTYTPIYTDVTNSGGATLLPLNPANWVNCILVNDTYLIWTAKDLEVGYVNLQKLASGAYGTVLAEDLSLLKPQCMIPPTGVYGSDGGRAANYLYGNLPQFIVQSVNDEFNYSAWSTRSKRLTPYQQNTPVLGVDVTQNNYIIVSVNIGSIRATTINLAYQFDDSNQFFQFRSVTRAYVTALPNTAVNVSAEIFEAYNPTTNIYSYAWYNNDVVIPIPATETDLDYDYIWPSSCSEKINGNIAAISDFKTLYARPTTDVTISAVGYNPQINIPSGTFTNPLRTAGFFPGASGSGAGNHKRIMSITLAGVPHTGDSILVRTADIRNASSIENYSYTVPSALDGNLAGVVGAYAVFFPNSSYVLNGDGSYTITWTDNPYFSGQLFSVALFFAGASVANSIPSILDNTNYQLAIRYRDIKGRPFPLCTGNKYFVSTPSYAQVNGNAIEITITINTAAAPQGAYDYQILITSPPVTKILDTTAISLAYKGGWNASSNTPTLSVNSGNIGDTYQITVPAVPDTVNPYHDLGTHATYATGDYIVNVGGSSDGSANGQYYSVLPRTFGNLAGTGGILAFSLNSLALLNSEYSQQSVTTNLVYDFAPGDRCTLHYWIDGSGNINYFNQPCIDLPVLGYDAGTDTLKVEMSAALTFSGGNLLYNGQQINARNIFMRLYSPQPKQTSETQTVWYEIGDRYTITNGLHDSLSLTIKDGGVYFKTRQFPDAVQPYSQPPKNVLATDLNYSDFYTSPYWSKGRVATFYDVLEQAEQKASTITSQNYVIGSRVNGLNRFYPANIYGELDGQTSSSFGAIIAMWQRGDVLILIQERNVFYVPVNIAYQALNDQLTGIAISEKLLNNGRYSATQIGIGRLKESFWQYKGLGGFVSPFLSEPVRLEENGVLPISGKNLKYFKQLISAAYGLGKRIHQYYDSFYKETALCVQSQAAIIKLFSFDTNDWNPNDRYILAPGDITATTNGAHSTVSYNGATGIATYTPASNYVGGDTATFTFNPGVTKNVCLNWTAGSGNVNPFAFNPLTGVPLSTLENSNTIGVNGNDYPVTISITGSPGAAYSINGGAFTSAPGTVNKGDNVQVQVTSSGSLNTLTSATLTIDGQSATFNVTTRTSTGNFTATAQYNMQIQSVLNGSGSGVPAGYNPCNLNSNGASLTAAYTTLTAGTYQMVLNGTPAIPGHTYAALQVNSVLISSVLITGGGTYTLTLGSPSNDPTPVVFTIITM